jgi:hypothetical protein
MSTLLERRRLMMQMQSIGNAWLYGYKIVRSNGNIILEEDANYASIVNIQLDSNLSHKVYLGDTNILDFDNCKLYRQQETWQYVEYFTGYSYFRNVSPCKYVSICTNISQVENVVLGYLPDKQIEDAYVILGEKEISLGNYIFRYYTRNFGASPIGCSIIVPNTLPSSRITFLLRNPIYYYDIDKNYVSYWNSSFPNSRTVNVNSTVAYFTSNYDINETSAMYIKDTNSGQTIWSNNL